MNQEQARIVAIPDFFKKIIVIKESMVTAAINHKMFSIIRKIPLRKVLLVTQRHFVNP